MTPPTTDPMIGPMFIGFEDDEGGVGLGESDGRVGRDADDSVTSGVDNLEDKDWEIVGTTVADLSVDKPGCRVGDENERSREDEIGDVGVLDDRGSEGEGISADGSREGVLLGLEEGVEKGGVEEGVDKLEEEGGSDIDSATNL
ncbi:hypothetical protein NLI96_g490 [Meripilus lineatus]|uniref:Uncharacterized protein n=1 Tax=Meripilus lineatus TaxID=2056292 RepID=A0AAD5VGE5_9APHY|nr:hypothetical protein NLI96_g490 [Physisporinus lineatus]